MLESDAMAGRVEDGRSIEEESGIIGKLRQSLKGVCFGVTPSEMCDNQLYFGIALSYLTNFADIIRMPKPGSFWHVQRNPGLSVVYYLEHMVW